MNTDTLSWLIPLALVVAFLVLKRLGQISGPQARQLVKDGALLLDVRSKAEFDTGHIPGAKNVPVGEVASKAKSLGAKDRAVVVYCASGARSSMARSTLKALGFEKVYNLGALTRW